MEEYFIEKTINLLNGDSRCMEDRVKYRWLLGVCAAIMINPKEDYLSWCKAFVRKNTTFVERITDRRVRNILKILASDFAVLLDNFPLIESNKIKKTTILPGTVFDEAMAFLPGISDFTRENSIYDLILSGNHECALRLLSANPFESELFRYPGLLENSAILFKSMGLPAECELMLGLYGQECEGGGWGYMFLAIGLQGHAPWGGFPYPDY